MFVFAVISGCTPFHLRLRVGIGPGTGIPNPHPHSHQHPHRIQNQNLYCIHARDPHGGGGEPERRVTSRWPSRLTRVRRQKVNKKKKELVNCVTVYIAFEGWIVCVLQISSVPRAVKTFVCPLDERISTQLSFI